jgi:hypothetical protein
LKAGNGNATAATKKKSNDKVKIDEITPDDSPSSSTSKNNEDPLDDPEIQQLNKIGK